MSPVVPRRTVGHEWIVVSGASKSKHARKRREVHGTWRGVKNSDTSARVEKLTTSAFVVSVYERLLEFVQMISNIDHHQSRGFPATNAGRRELWRGVGGNDGEQGGSLLHHFIHTVLDPDLIFLPLG